MAELAEKICCACTDCTGEQSQSQSKYKVGDKVQVKQNLVAGQRYGLDGVVTDMLRMAGKMATIVSVTKYGKYHIAEDDGWWVWTDEMFEDTTDIVRMDIVRMEMQNVVQSAQSEQAQIVFVKHRASDAKEYAFEVPAEMAQYLKKGMRVRVETKKGAFDGNTTTDVICGDRTTIEELLKRNGAYLPLKKVLAAYKTTRLDDIQIPKPFRNSFPASYKVKNCYETYITYRRFDRDIVVDKDNILTDGYVAYLIARMIGIVQVKVTVKY